MKMTRRMLLKIITVSGVINSIHTFSKTSSQSIKTGDFRSLDPKVAVSGILVLESLDISMKISKKTIYGDGHGHVVPISSRAWKLLLKEKTILVRSGLDSVENNHAHWIKVKIS